MSELSCAFSNVEAELEENGNNGTNVVGHLCWMREIKGTFDAVAKSRFMTSMFLE